MPKNRKKVLHIMSSRKKNIRSLNYIFFFFKVMVQPKENNKWNTPSP